MLGAAAVPLLYTELYKENPFDQEMAPAPAPFQVAPRPGVSTNGSSYKNRAASSPDLGPLQEISRYVVVRPLRDPWLTFCGAAL